MTISTKRWYALGTPERTTLRCPVCRNDFDLGHLPADHHPGVCPVCGVASVFLTWVNRPVQIVLENAPPALAHVMRWCQQHLDELDFMELLCALEELAGEIRTPV